MCSAGTTQVSTLSTSEAVPTASRLKAGPGPAGWPDPSCGAVLVAREQCLQASIVPAAMLAHCSFPPVKLIWRCPETETHPGVGPFFFVNHRIFGDIIFDPWPDTSDGR